jgi:nanoRNase/pAp phosphatase (c-di-AMP/oligoRNAs hydrolase)
MSPEKLEHIFEAVQGADNVLILPHNDPDPDAIASAVGLAFLLAEQYQIMTQIVYEGIIGRAENKAMVRYLGRPLRRLEKSDLDGATHIALVDTQPGAGNNALPPKAAVSIVIDHHPYQVGSDKANYADVRPDVGASASILTEYLQMAGLQPRPRLATALFYGIKTDTMGLGRNISELDVSAYFYLQARIDIEALVQIERDQVPADYFKNFDATLRAVRVYEHLVVSYIGSMVYPDLAAEMADVLLRLKGAEWVICMGTHDDALILAVRTGRRRGAGQLVQNIVGDYGSAGGHNNMAGGYVLLDGQDPDQLSILFRQRALAHLEIPPDAVGKPLI